MRSDDVLLLGIGIQPPWQLVDQHLDTSTQPHELHLQVAGERGARYPCPTCGALCPAHDFQEKRWRHLNFFQHHCYITASVPRVKCPDHGVRQVEVPWARKGSAFTLLFEQAALALVREMPVLAAARLMDITDTRLWRIVKHYVAQAISQFDLSSVRGIGLDETASKRGHNYVTVFIDMERRKEPVLFVTPGRGKVTLQQFANFLKSHGGDPQQVLEVVCDMSPAFINGVKEHLPEATTTVDWFHIVQVFTRSVDSVRKLEGKEKPLPKQLGGTQTRSGGPPDREPVARAGRDYRPGTRHGHSLADQGKARLGAQGQNTERSALADNPLPELGILPGWRHAGPGARAKSAGYLEDACGSSSSTLDLNLYQCAAGRLEWHIPGSEGESPRVPQHGDVHDHDLPDCQPCGLDSEIHMN